MLVVPEEYANVYRAIQEDIHNSEEKHVTIFVATDSCDSVCAVKVLQVCSRHVLDALLPASAITRDTVANGSSGVVKTCGAASVYPAETQHTLRHLSSLTLR